jgi:hypothetical protein
MIHVHLVFIGWIVLPLSQKSQQTLAALKAKEADLKNAKEELAKAREECARLRTQLASRPAGAAGTPRPRGAVQPRAVRPGGAVCGGLAHPNKPDR